MTVDSRSTRQSWESHGVGKRAQPVTKAEQVHDEEIPLPAGKAPTPQGETQVGHLNVIHFSFLIGFKVIKQQQ